MRGGHAGSLTRDEIHDTSKGWAEGAAVRLQDEWCKLEALARTLSVRALVRVLEVLVLAEKRGGVVACLLQAALPEARRASEVQCLPRGSQTSAGRRPLDSGVAWMPSSAGRDGSKPAFSRSAWRPAATASAWSVSRTTLWRRVRSPLQGHTNAWSPNRSMQAPHAVQ